MALAVPPPVHVFLTPDASIPAYSLTGPEMGRPPGRSPRQICRGGLRRQQQRPDGDDSKEREGRKRKAAAEPAVEAETEAETEAEAEAAAICQQ